jgi:carbamate kinase
MKKKRIVIALGHEALGSTLPEQQKAAVRTAKAVADFIREDYQVVITHSNGPQVGMIHTAMNEFARLYPEYTATPTSVCSAMSEFCRIYPEYTATPTSVCSAMSQGYIGYDLQNAIRTELLNRGIYKTVSTVLTQVIVDPYDEAFYNPTKAIGRVMTKAEAEEEEKKGNHVVEAGGGFRRIIAAPKPMDIVEIDAIRALSDADQVVIACGGGGIPVLAQNNNLQGASAVIEKDLAAGRLAELLDADMLVILTSVDKVCLSFGTDGETKLDTMTVAEAKRYLTAGEFGEGTMAPKIEAAIGFIGDSAIRTVLITKLNKEGNEITGGMGTLIKK